MDSLPGLSLIEDFITNKEGDELIKIINTQEWNKKIKRWTQHYGFEYDYKNRSIQKKTLPIPNWLNPIILKITQKGIIKEIPNQIIINRYLPGEGISPHIDLPHVFKNKIYSISLGSACIMNFSRKDKKIDIKVNQQLIMKNDVRYKWKHGIKPVKTDLINGKRIKRTIRYSITFRNLVQNKNIA